MMAAILRLTALLLLLSARTWAAAYLPCNSKCDSSSRNAEQFLSILTSSALSTLLATGDNGSWTRDLSAELNVQTFVSDVYSAGSTAKLCTCPFITSPDPIYYLSVCDASRLSGPCLAFAQYQQQNCSNATVCIDGILQRATLDCSGISSTYPNCTIECGLVAECDMQSATKSPTPVPTPVPSKRPFTIPPFMLSKAGCQHLVLSVTVLAMTTLWLV